MFSYIMLNILRDFNLPKIRRFNIRENNDEVAYGMCLGHIYPWGWALRFNGNERFTPKICFKTTQKKNKLIYEAAIKLMKDYDPNFKFTSIMINKNIKYKKHIDRYNNNLSYIIGLGDYEGGNLLLYDKRKNDRNGNGEIVESINIKNNFFKFDGHQYHSTDDFTGERYTIVYYSICDYNEDTKQYFL